MKQQPAKSAKQHKNVQKASPLGKRKHSEIKVNKEEKIEKIKRKKVLAPVPEDSENSFVHDDAWHEENKRELEKLDRETAELEKKLGFKNDLGRRKRNH